MQSKQASATRNVHPQHELEPPLVGQVRRLLGGGPFVPYHASFIRLPFDTREHGGGPARHGRELTKE